MAIKRKIEIFTAGCPLCDAAIQLVNEIACPRCEVSVLDLREKGAMARARAIGVVSTPTVAADGRIIDCCKRGEVDRAALAAAGVGQP
ncbi:thioredoxin family protein [Candidatus Manganitrophus noduliformans]|uniref:Thioredoxin-like fold domain-containing protein n=1 Tax=Candidatus Manganitrophus noduliformans TaxID=2606439 RepID=A0A7X6IA73_9BACT|nr:thioredoxin family protein [Candidatus Manganitrophus noduliformans]NKE70238.1 hypothetical protein [Candidatus Manganitrophus noduliformans]